MDKQIYDKLSKEDKRKLEENGIKAKASKEVVKMRIKDTEGVLIDPVESKKYDLKNALKYINETKEPERTQMLADKKKAVRLASGLDLEDWNYIMNLHKQAKAKLEKESTMKSQNNDDADDEALANIIKEYEGMSVSAISKSVNRIFSTFVKSGAFAKYLTRKVNVPPSIEAGASCFNENSTTDSEELWRLTLSPQA